jgi:hypothetical protein
MPTVETPSAIPVKTEIPTVNVSTSGEVVTPSLLHTATKTAPAPTAATPAAASTTAAPTAVVTPPASQAPRATVSQPTSTSLAITDISDNRSDYTSEQIPAYKKLEITFQVQNTVAQNFQFPYDPSPPPGMDSSYPKRRGISVEALFLPPGASDWNQAYRQPGFYYQYFDDQIKRSWDGKDREWHYPSGRFAWKVRFSPNQTGTWQYRLSAQDAGGSYQTSPQSFTVVASNDPGFIKVSATDRRYFEFDDGRPFFAIGLQGAGAFDDPVLGNEPEFQQYGQNGINLDRIWISSMYGTAWLEWLGGRNIYDGYLPRAGTEAFHDPVRNQDFLTMRIDYEADGDKGWYDACRFQFWDNPEAIKPHTDYRLSIKYWGQNITGPRMQSSPRYGLVGKIGGDWAPNCYERGASTAITNYGGDTSDWGTVAGTWNSGDNNFLPRVYLGLENVTQGAAYILSISLREELGNGQYGPEILMEPSMEYQLYYPEQSAYAMDKIVNLAEQNGVYLKLVLMEKNDMIYSKLNDNGTFVIGGEADNQDGFYGLGRGMNKTRWLQQAWWRYLQARWGYSPHIHSWELTNEGDPWLKSHWELTDELGKFMHCRVFGIQVGSGDGAKCSYDHPDDHLVTTSFWASFPGEQFWGNPAYPNVDYADVHAYVSTGWLRNPAYESDAALYHLDYSADVRSNLDYYSSRNSISSKPIMRGEAGIDFLGEQTEQPDLALDKTGVWLHNYTWALLDPGAMTELYWWGDNLANQPGPDGKPGLYEIYGYFHDFIKDIPFNNGHYQGAAAQASNPNLRVIGQKDTLDDRAHLWVQNKNHTWRNVVEGANNINGLSGTVTLGGFKANSTFNVAWYAFTTQGIPDIQTSTVDSDGAGTIVLSMPTDPQISDAGIKIGDYNHQ